MYENKRSLEFSDVLNVETKKIRINNKENNEMTSIEYLSNELFYEIFKYLNGFHIYEAFNNLNYRFQHLISHSSLLLNIEFDFSSSSKIEHYYKNIILPNTHRILSISFANQLFINKFLKDCIIDSSFHRLESIYINYISYDSLLFTFLFNLKSLSRLFSLSLCLEKKYSNDLSTIYQMILSLPTLKYNKLTLFSEIEKQFGFDVPLSINEQFSTIKYLIICHNCTFYELCSILQHTPQLLHLSCGNVIASDVDTGMEILLKLSNLIYLHINNCDIDFDEFEMFIRKISSQLKIMYIRQDIGDGYLDADRWERLIKTYIPHLHRFYYEYYHEHNGDCLHDDEGDILPYTNFDLFTSSFWIEKQWFFKVEIGENEITYSINSYKNFYVGTYYYSDIATYFNRNIIYNSIQYLNMINQKDIEQSSRKFIPPIQLNIYDISSEEQSQSSIDKFKSICATVPFTHLRIYCEDISIEILVKLIHMLPNLDSLEIISLPAIQQDWFFDKDVQFCSLKSISNKITEVHFEKMIDIEQVHFLLYLCMSLQYFQVDVPTNMNLELLVRSVLVKAYTYRSQLRCLCLHIRKANEKIVHQLQTLIDTENLLTNYMIKRISNSILLKWN